MCVQEGEGRGSVYRSRSQDYIYPATLETEPRVQGFIISLPRNTQTYNYFNPGSKLFLKPTLQRGVQRRELSIDKYIDVIALYTK